MKIATTYDAKKENKSQGSEREEKQGVRKMQENMGNQRIMKRCVNVDSSIVAKAPLRGGC